MQQKSYWRALECGPARKKRSADLEKEILKVAIAILFHQLII